MLYAAVLSLLPACAPNVAFPTMMALVGAESGYNEFAIHDNTQGAADPKVSSADEAVSVARGMIIAGKSVDLGLAQINSANLSRLGLTVDMAFDPCTNLRAAAAILASGYANARAVTGEGAAALRLALSAYHTGNWSGGFRDGYVERVQRRGQSVRVPDILNPASLPTAPALISRGSSDNSPDWDVFRELSAAGPVASPRATTTPSSLPSALEGTQQTRP